MSFPRSPFRPIVVPEPDPRAVELARITAREAAEARTAIADTVLTFVQRKFNEWIALRWQGGGMPLNRASLFEAEGVVRQFTELVYPGFRIRLKVSDDGRELTLENEDAGQPG